MGTADRTKLLLADELKAMSAAMPISRIRVSMLCQRCGVDRRTFYYHFRDVYDLVAWIFDRVIDEFQDFRGGRPNLQGMTKILKRFREEDVFYRRALTEDSQNALGRHFLSSTKELYNTALQVRLGRELTEEERFTVAYHCFGSLGVIRHWIINESNTTAEQIAGRLGEVMPPLLRGLYEDGQAGEGGQSNVR